MLVQIDDRVAVFSVEENESWEQNNYDKFQKEYKKRPSSTEDGAAFRTAPIVVGNFPHRLRTTQRMARNSEAGASTRYAAWSDQQQQDKQAFLQEQQSVVTSTPRSSTPARSAPDGRAPGSQGVRAAETVDRTRSVEHTNVVIY